MIKKLMPDDRRPAMIPSLADFYWQGRVLGRRIPLLASFKLTYRCNLACAQCPFHLRAQEPGAHMTWERACACLDILARKGCRIVVFEGGEPLLWKDGDHDFAELARHAARRFLRVAATTNGTLPLDVPTDVLWVSIDGTAPTHDALRSSSHERIMRNIAGSSHPKLFIHTTINSENYRDIEHLTRDILALPTVRGITFQLFYPYDQGESHLALSPDQRREALETVMRLKHDGLPVMNSFWSLRTMIDNSWTCHQDLLVNVDPDGHISSGCYVSGRGEVRCDQCGFTPVAEASGAYDLHPGSLLAGWRLFLAP